MSSKSVQWEAEFDADKRTDGHDEANSRFTLFCERAWKLVKILYVRLHVSVIAYHFQADTGNDSLFLSWAFGFW